MFMSLCRVVIEFSRVFRFEDVFLSDVKEEKEDREGREEKREKEEGREEGIEGGREEGRVCASIGGIFSRPVDILDINVFICIFAVSSSHCM